MTSASMLTDSAARRAKMPARSVSVSSREEAEAGAEEEEEEEAEGSLSNELEEDDGLAAENVGRVRKEEMVAKVAEESGAEEAV